MDRTGAAYDAPGLRKAVGLIELLCDSEGDLGLSDISRRLGLNKPTVLRMLRTLTEAGWVVRRGDPPRYAAGLRLFHHASKPVRRMTIRVAAEEPLRRLWRATGASTYLAVLDDDKALYIESLDSLSSVQISGRVGGRYDLHCSAPGKVLLAWSDDSLLDRLARKGFERRTRRTICSLPRLRAHLRQIHRMGYAVDNEEYVKGVLCFAVPVYDYAGRVAGTAGITTLTMYTSVDEMIRNMGPKVIAAGREISAALGYRPEADKVSP